MLFIRDIPKLRWPKVFLTIVLLMVIGCQGAYYKTLPPELVPLAKYDEAITTMVAVKTSFNTTVNAEPDPLVKKKMLDVAYPLFERADTALMLWKSSVDAGDDPTAKIRFYQAVWLELSTALLQMGIVEVK